MGNSYKKIRDLDELTVITKDHLVPVASPEGVAGETTGRATASNFMGAVINNSSTFEIDQNGNLKIKAGAITAADIGDGAIGSEKLRSTGVGSIDIQNIARKNVIVHIGNYYRRGVKYYGSDLFNASGDYYNLRSTEVVQWAGNSAHPDPFYGYFSASSSDEVIEPFATVVAAARYVLFNHGDKANITILVHGHVAWCGQYDIPSGYVIKNVGNWTPFLNVGITAGRHPDDNPWATSQSDSFTHLDNYANGMSRSVAARIDVDGSITPGGIPPGQWFRAPTMYVSGLNMVYHGAETQEPRWDGAKGAGGFHEIRGMKMQMVGGSYFSPWNISKSDFFFSSGGNQPNEIHTTTADFLCFKIGNANGTYSNNASSNGLFLSSDKANCVARFMQSNSGGSFVFKHSQVYTRPGSTFSTANNTFAHNGGFSSFFFQTEVIDDVDQKSWVPGDGTTLYSKQDGTYSSDPADKSDSYYFNAKSGTLLNGTSSPSTGDQTNLLGNRMINWTSKASLSVARLSGYSNLKAAPTARSGNGGTSSSAAPYADQ